MGVRNRAVLFLQRHSRWLPRPLRGRGRRVLMIGSSPVDPINGWDEPRLVVAPGRPAVPLPPAGAAPSLPIAAPVAPSRPGPRLRCLLMTIPLDIGGLDEVVAALTRHLPAAGLDVAVLQTAAGTKRPGRLARELSGAVRVFTAASEAEAAAAIDEFEPDVVSVHDAPDWAVATAHARAIPCVETLHGMQSLFGVTYEQILPRRRMLSGVVAVSELLREQYLMLTEKWEPDRVVTVPNAVDPARLAAPPRPAARRWLGVDDEFLFVSLSRHCLQKNTYGLAAAFEDVAERHGAAHLLIAGRLDDHLYAGQVRRLRDGMRVSDRVHLREHLADPAVLLAAADAFVLDSFFEGWALASMEALCLGVPVVLADVGGAREQVRAGTPSGILVPNPLGEPLDADWPSMAAARFERQRNRAELVAAMRSMIDTRAEWDARRAAIAAESLSRFSSATMIERHAHVLRAAAQRRAVTLPEELAV